MSATAQSKSRSRVRLVIEADRCVEMLPRVLGIISQQALIPAGMSLHGLGGSLSLTLILDDLDEHLAGLVIGRIRRAISIRSVSLVPIEAAIALRN